MRSGYPLAEVQNRIVVRIINLVHHVIWLFGGCASRTAELNFVFCQLPPLGSTILDVGCCGSLLPLELARRGFKVYGIDTRCYRERHPELSFVRGDIMNSPFPVCEDYFGVLRFRLKSTMWVGHDSTGLDHLRKRQRVLISSGMPM